MGIETVRDGAGVYTSAPLPELNHVLLEETVAWANWSTDNDEIAWDQSHWAVTNDQTDNHCGAYMCICGKGLQTLGHVEFEKSTDSYERLGLPPVEYTSLKFKVTNLDKLLGPDYEGPAEMPGGNAPWREAGCAAFGLTADEGDQLFAGENELSDVIRISNSICESRGLPHLNLDRWSFMSREGVEQDA